MGTRRIAHGPIGDGGIASQRSGLAPPALAGPLGPGARVGRYELVSLLGSGGMADVWLAAQSSAAGFHKRVALKTIKPGLASEPRFRQMFRDEACVAVRIRHANVVEVLDLGEENGVLYQAMSLVEGGSLAALLLRARATLGSPGLPPGVAARVVADALRGLHAAHALRDDAGRPTPVVHRDVCPRNILVGFDGVAKLADFGIARAGAVLAGRDLGHGRGKRRYASPEIRGGSPATARSDLYAAAVVLWEALTGATHDADRGPADPRQLAPAVPAALAEVVLRGLAPAPELRFTGADAMADAIEAAALAAGCLCTSQGVAEVVGRAFESSAERASVELTAVIGDTNASVASDVSLDRPRRARVGPLAAGAALAVVVALAAGVGARFTSVAEPAAAATPRPPWEPPRSALASQPAAETPAKLPAEAETRLATEDVRGATSAPAPAGEPAAAPPGGRRAGGTPPRARRPARAPISSATPPRLSFDNPYE